MIIHTFRPLLPLIVLFSTSISITDARKITVKNSCKSTIWPGMHTGSGQVPTQVTGWELAALGETQFDVPDNWIAGRIWARTGCVTQDGKFQCLTGGCGQGLNGDKSCQVTNEPPSTLAEFTFATNGVDNYDVSLVDGFNVPLVIKPSIDSCDKPSCPVNINPLCPPLLRTGIDQTGQNFGCIAACNAGFGQELYGNRACCSGAYNDPILCAICGVDYYNLFKDNCKTSYAYAYDEKTGTALYTCPSKPGSMSDYTIEFCPDNTDYVGTVEPGQQYLNATATCSNKVSSGTQTFSVPPSPTKTAVKGTLQVIATVATGLDGAAAVQVGASTSGSSSSGPAQSISMIQDIGVVASSSSAPPTRITKIFTEVSGSTLFQIIEGDGNGQTSTVTSTLASKVTEVGALQTDLRKGGKHCKGGQWLKGVPELHTQQRKKKRGKKAH